jgi:hypothetical protein
MAKHSPNYPMVMGLSPATAPCTMKVTRVKKKLDLHGQQWWHNGKTPCHHHKVEGLSPTTMASTRKESSLIHIASGGWQMVEHLPELPLYPKQKWLDQHSTFG